MVKGVIYTFKLHRVLEFRSFHRASQAVETSPEESHSMRIRRHPMTIKMAGWVIACTSCATAISFAFLGDVSEVR